jgi:hypothetical protein
MGELAEVDDLVDGEGLHGVAAVGSAASGAELLIEKGSMFARGDPDCGTVVFGLEGPGAGDLADVADGVLMGGGVPVEGLVFFGVFEVKACGVDEDGDVFGVEGVAVGAAVGLPEMVVVELDGVGGR